MGVWGKREGEVEETPEKRGRERQQRREDESVEKKRWERWGMVWHGTRWRDDGMEGVKKDGGEGKGEGNGQGVKRLRREGGRKGDKGQSAVL